MPLSRRSLLYRESRIYAVIGGTEIDIVLPAIVGAQIAVSSKSREGVGRANGISPFGASLRRFPLVSNDPKIAK